MLTKHPTNVDYRMQCLELRAALETIKISAWQTLHSNPSISDPRLATAIQYAERVLYQTEE